MTYSQLWRPNLASLHYTLALGMAYQRHQWIWDPDYASVQDTEAWVKIRRDAHTAFAVHKRRASVAALGWSVQPASDEPADELVARLQNGMLRNIRQSWMARYLQTEFIFRGSAYGYVEGTYRWIRIDGDTRVRRWWIPTRIRHVDRWRLRIEPDHEYRQEHPYSSATRWEMYHVGRQEWMPLGSRQQGWFIASTYEPSEDTLGYGRGLLQAIFFYWRAKEVALTQGLAGMERWAQGLIKVAIDGKRAGSVDRDNDTVVDESIAQLKKHRSEHVLAHDKDDEVEVLTGGMEGHQIVTSFLEYLDRGIDRLCLSSSLPTGGGPSDTGSYGRAESEKGEMHATFRADRMMLAEDYDHSLLDLAWRLNLGNIVDACREQGHRLGQRGRLDLQDDHAEDPKDVATQVQTLVQIPGMKLVKREVYDRSGWTMPRGDEETIGGDGPAGPGGPDDGPGGGDPLAALMGGQMSASPASGALAYAADMDRREMPQFSPEVLERFLGELEEDGIEVARLNVPAGRLKPTQEHLVAEKIAAIRDQGEDLAPVLVASGNEIIDGHHRWAARLGKRIPIIRVGLSADDLIDRAHECEGVERRDLDDDQADYAALSEADFTDEALAVIGRLSDPSWDERRRLAFGVLLQIAAEDGDLDRVAVDLARQAIGEAVDDDLGDLLGEDEGDDYSLDYARRKGPHPAAGKPCQRGQTAKQTGCISAAMRKAKESKQAAAFRTALKAARQRAQAAEARLRELEGGKGSEGKTEAASEAQATDQAPTNTATSKRERMKRAREAAESRQEWGTKEQPFFRPGPNPTVDMVLTRTGPDGEKQVLLIKRRDGEGVAEGGKWALPGGFVDSTAGKGEFWDSGKTESPEDAAFRELTEETGLSADQLRESVREVGKFDRHGRDPRDNDEAWSESTAFTLDVSDLADSGKVEGLDDAEAAEWVNLSEIESGGREMAFDHSDIIDDADMGAPGFNPKAKPPEPDEVKSSAHATRNQLEQIKRDGKKGKFPGNQVAGMLDRVISDQDVATLEELSKSYKPRSREGRAIKRALEAKRPNARDTPKSKADKSANGQAIKRAKAVTPEEAAGQSFEQFNHQAGGGGPVQIGEVSPVQLARMSGAQKKRYFEERAKRGEARGAVADIYRAKAIEHGDALAASGLSTLDIKGRMDRDAYSAWLGNKIDRDKAAKAQAAKADIDSRMIRSSADLKVGDTVVDRFTNGTAKVAKINRKSVVVEGDFGRVTIPISEKAPRLMRPEGSDARFSDDRDLEATYGQGEPCEKGETAARSGCIPADDSGGGGDLASEIDAVRGIPKDVKAELKGGGGSTPAEVARAMLAGRHRPKNAQAVALLEKIADGSGQAPEAKPEASKGPDPVGAAAQAQEATGLSWPSIDAVADQMGGKPKAVATALAAAQQEGTVRLGKWNRNLVELEDSPAADFAFLRKLDGRLAVGFEEIDEAIRSKSVMSGAPIWAFARPQER